MNIKTSSQNLPKVKLIDALSLIRNGMNIKQGVVIGGLPITRIETISNGEICLEKVGYAGLEKRESSGYMLKEGDILFSHINSPTHLGKTAMYNKDKHGDLIHGMNLLCLRANQEKAYPKYLNYAINAPTFKSQLPKITKKAVNQASIAIADLKELEILLPPLPEQKRIAAILDKADSLRRKNQQAIQLADKFLRAVFLDMFGDPVTNPKGFPVGTIRDLITSANYGTSAKASETDGGFPILRMGNITYEGGWDFSDLKYIDLSEREHDKYLVKKGDLLFNRTNSKELVGKTAVYERDEAMAIAGYLIRVRNNEHGNPYYISAYLNSKHGKTTLLNMCKSIVGMANINAQELQDIKILLPPKTLQDKFEKIVVSTNQKLKSFTQAENYSSKMFSALSQKAFSGEL